VIRLAVVSVLLAVLVAAVILNLTAANGKQSPIAGDPVLYNAIATAILDGAIPYLDVPVEHFPGALVPMVFSEGLSRVTGLRFETLWLFAMGTVFVISAAIADGIPTDFSAGRRYLLLSLPLLPLVLFRIEPWLMVWVVTSIVLAFRAAWPAHLAATLIASMTKGWPVLLFALPFRLGRKSLGVLGGAATFLALLAVAVLPGFREGRAFEGIHTETIVGNIILVFRSATGAELQLIGVAGGAYAEAGPLALLLNALIGLPFLVLSGALIFRRKKPVELVQALGLGVMGIILASPLFSSQFLYWLVPFVLLLSTARQRLYVLTSTMTLITVILWAPHAPEWSVMVLARNVLLLALAIGWARDVLTTNQSKEPLLISENVS
jgi:hypothetical protein